MSVRRSRSKIGFSLNDMWGLIEVSGVLASLRAVYITIYNSCEVTLTKSKNEWCN